MGREQQKGFTIIEVVLFLAISGLMLSLIMMNVGKNIEQQHYRDSVQQLRDIIAGEFDAISSLTNNQNGGVAGAVCLKDGAVTGSSPCFYSGRMITIVPDGAESKVVSYPVIATETAGVADDRPDKYTYRAHMDSDNRTERRVLWGTSVTNGLGGQFNGYIYIARSPYSGEMRVSTSSSPYAFGGATGLQSLPSNLFMAPPAAADLNLCVQSGDSGITPSQVMAVLVPAGIRSASDLKVRACS